MQAKFVNLTVLAILLVCQFSVCLGKEAPDANNSSKYLDAVREFADNVLKYGRDTYGPKRTPLFVDGMNIHTHEPVKWIDPDGTKWILSNLASQQNLFRVLVGLTRITGDPKYKQAAMDAIKYAFENLHSPNGLLYWGGSTAYDARSDKVCGKKTHVLKYHYPYYELMWEIDSKATKKFIESFWSAHILDWSNLGMNRIGPLDRLRVPEGWDHEYKGGPAFFESQGRSFVNAGSDLYYAAAILSKQSGNKLSLIWAKRLAHRYIETRYPNVGIAGYVYTYQDHFQVYQLAEDFKGHRVLMGTLFPKHPSVGNPDVRQWFLGELIVSPGIAGDIFIIPWICQFLLGEMLGEDGKEFTKWALDELTAWGKIAYRKKNNSFIPMLTDGTILEGYVCKKGSIFGPKGTVFTPIPAVSMDFWAYALAYRMTGDKFMWEMARNIAQGIGFGDIGVSPDSELQLKKDTGCSDPYVLLGFLELYKKTRTKLFLLMAERIGDNIVTDHFYKGFFVPSHKHTYAKFDAIDPLVLLNLSTTLDVKPSLVSRVWPSRPLFKSPYRRGREGAIDNTIIYNLTELSEPPKSLQEAAVCGEIHEIKSLISKGADVNGIEDAWVRTALHYAAMNGNKQVVELLLAKGADVNAEDADGTTALGYAAGRGHKEVAELLIVKGGDVNAADNRGFTSSHNAVDGGHKDVAELLIAEGADINAKNAVGNAPLHYAAERGLKDIAEMFIVNGVDINAKNKEGLTPVDIALDQNHKDIVELLLEEGVELFSIHLAAYLGDIEKVKSFIETGTSVNGEPGRGHRTPLYWAVRNDHKDVADLLIEKGADVSSSVSLLYYVCMHGHRDLAEFLIQKGADVNSKNWVDTPSHYAVWGGYVDVLELLLAHGADANAKGSAAGSLLYYAAGSGSTDMTRLLLNKSADVNAKENKGGQTPLHRAAEKGHTTVVELLITNGADINTKDNQGWIPLHYAQENGHTKIVELLRKSTANLESSSEPRHDVAITGVSALSRDPQDYNTLPVVVNIENQGDCGESFDVKLIDVTDGKEIGTKSVTLSPAGAGGMDEICDLIFTEESPNRQRFGTKVHHGDVNGDGYDDLLVAASRYGNIQGRAYLYYGGGNMDKNADKIFFGEKPGDYFSVGGCIADLNGDRYDDVILGAFGHNSDQGRVYVYYGGPDFDEHADVTIDGEPGVAGGFGRTCTAGDVNGDGYEDLFVGAIRYPKKKYRGRIYLFYGGYPMDTTCDLILTGENVGDAFGWMTDASGDVDGDNLCDLLTGTRWWPKSVPSDGDNIGRAYLYYGGDPMDGSCDVIFTGENPDNDFGGGIEVGDVDNDGRADIFVGARGYDSSRGRVYLYWGKAKENMNNKVDKIFEGRRRGDNFGGDDIEVGYVDNDRFRDIAIMAFGWRSGRGRTYLYYGSTKADMDTACDLTFTGIDDATNWPMHAAIGDFNKDGYGDLVIGAWAYKNQQGTAWLYYGGPGDSTQLKFDWDTTSASPGEHTLKAAIDPVAGEKDIADNTVTMTVEVKEPSK